MNFQTRIDRLQGQLDDLRSELSRAEDMTAKVLAAAEANGVDRIGIGKLDATVHETEKFPFGASGSIFCKGKGPDGWPLAWKVAEDAGVSAGCGNSGQHQVSGVFVDGVYERTDGEWRLVEASS